MKSLSHQALSTGWYVESFSRIKNIKSLDEYLKPALSPEQKRDTGAHDLRAMISRMASKQGKTDGPR